MLKAGDLVRREDRRLKGVKIGKPDEIRGYHMYAYTYIVYQDRRSSQHIHTLFIKIEGPVNIFIHCLSG